MYFKANGPIELKFTCKFSDKVQTKVCQSDRPWGSGGGTIRVNFISSKLLNSPPQNSIYSCSLYQGASDGM
jgi:hypothetical protein